MRLSVILVLVVSLLLAVSASGQTMARINIVPVVAHTVGAGNPPTYWVSDVTIHNPTDATIVFGALFFEEGVSTDLVNLQPMVLAIGPRETLFYPDILYTLFGYDENIKGGLAVDTGYMFPLGNGDDARLLITSRTYNTGDPSGTYGQTVPAAELFANLYGTPSFVTGARQDERYRSNLGVVSSSPMPVTVHWSARMQDGTVIKTGSLDLPTLSMRQWSFSSLGIGNQIGPLTLELWLDAEDVWPDPCAELLTNGFIAYVSKADGNPDGTGDAECIFAIPTQVPACWLDELFPPSS